MGQRQPLTLKRPLGNHIGPRLGSWDTSNQMAEFNSSFKAILKHPGFLAAAAFGLAAFLIGPDRTSTSAFHDYMRPYDPWLQLLTILGDGRVLLPACLITTL